MAEIKLYGANVCPFVHRARLALAEKALAYEYVAIDLRNKPDWYHDVLPTGKVPLLEHAGCRVWESSVVCEYLEEAFPQHPLLPPDPAGRASARIWISWCSELFVPTFYRLLREQDANRWPEHRNEMLDALRKLEETLQRSEWLVGDQLTLADLEIYPWFERWEVLQHYRDMQLPSEFTALARWNRSLAERPAVRQIAELPQFYVEQYLTYARPAETLPRD